MYNELCAPPGTFAFLNIILKCAFLRRQASNFKKFARKLSKHIQVKPKINDCLIFLLKEWILLFIIIVLCNHAYTRQKNGNILQEQKNGRDKSSGVFLCLFKDVFGLKRTTIWLFHLFVQTNTTLSHYDLRLCFSNIFELTRSQKLLGAANNKIVCWT